MAAKSFKITDFNVSDQRVQMYRDLVCNELAIGYGTCPSTERKHLQVYVTFKKTQRLATLARKLSATCQIARRQDWNYEIMETDGYEIIHRGEQGKRTDIEDAIVTLREEGLKAVQKQYPAVYIKFHSGIEKLSMTYEKQRDFVPIVKWIYGPTGTGKTRMVHESEPDLFVCNESNQWWDGYINQEAVLIDDFRADFCKFHVLLKILDRYPHKVAVKGGYREFNSKRIYITCPEHPEAVYQTIEDKQQLLRRISEIIYKD